MTKASGKTKDVQRILRGDFSGVVLKKSPSGDLTVDVSTLSGVNVTIIADSDAKIAKQVPTAAAFRPENAMIPAGLVHLNQISHFSTFFPDEAKAELLVSPKDTAVFIGRGLGTWLEDIRDIRSLDESHGLHFDDQVLTGMPVFDREEGGHNDFIGKEIANQLRSAWEQAKDSNVNVTTGLFMPTKELVHGCEMRSRKVTVPNNLYARREEIARQGGKFLTELGFGDARWYWSSTNTPYQSSCVYIVNFKNGKHDWAHIDGSRRSSRPVALRVLAPGH